jgi:Domain of Unknown Function (DUF1080)
MRNPLARAAAVALVILQFTTIESRADDSTWLNLLDGDKLDAFKPFKGSGWYFAESVAADEKNPRRLVGVKGSGILLNGEKGRAADLYTKEEFGDLELKMEFLIPKGSNSGVKFHGVYEIQILDTYGKKELTGDSCGGIYPRADPKTYNYLDKGIAPKVNACKPPGEWQSLEVIWHSPRFDASGKKTISAKIVKALLNGQVIHEDQEVATPTGGNWERKETPKGPFMLQGDHGPVAFRNIKIRSLKTH